MPSCDSSVMELEKTKEVWRYPIHIEDDSDSDAEVFVVPEQSARRLKVVKSPTNVGQISPLMDADKKNKKKEEKLGSHKNADVMEKSIIKPGFEQLEAVPKGGSRAMQKKKSRLERVKTSGEGWFNMKAPEMTEEVKQNLEVLQMRSAIDKNRVYKKNDMKTLPKYFAMGTVVEHAADFYSSRIPRKQRKKTLVEELMADVEVKKQLKKKASKLAVKKQLKFQNQLSKKKKGFKKRKKNAS